MKKLFLMLTATVVLSGVLYTSCKKNELTNDIQVNQPVNLKPIDNFSVNFDKTGEFSTNDKDFINNNHRINTALKILATSISKKKTSENTSFTIDNEGIINSNDPNYDGRFFAEVLSNEGGMSYYDKDFMVIFDKTGFKSISDENVFSLYPNLHQDLIEAGESYKEKLTENQTLTFTFSGNKFFVNGEEIPLFNSSKTGTYEEFKECVGYWWFFPGFNVIVCGVGELMQ